MRVLVLSTWFPYPPDNGSKIRAYHLTRALSEKHEVTLVAFRPDSTDGAAEADRVEVIPVFDDPFRHVNKPPIIKYASPIPLAFWPSRAMQHTIQQLRTSCRFHAVVAMQTPVAQYAASIPDVARVIDIDTSFSYQARQRYEHHLSMGARLRAWTSWQKTYRYERRAFQKFQACAVVSSLEADFVAAMIKNRKGGVEVIRNGVDCEYFLPGQYPVQPNTLIYNGALTYRANYDAMQYFLSTIYPLIQQQVPEVTLTITGSTTGVDLKGLHLAVSVKLPGRVDDMRPVIGGSAVCVVPIRQGSGTRLKILEAMAAGTPVVATTKSTEGLGAVDGEHLLLADDAEIFADKTLWLLRSKNLRQKLAANARRFVEQYYNWNHVCQQFVELVDTTSDRYGRRS
jgi:glycosyltransferase involved in cell wall biosynthesis